MDNNENTDNTLFEAHVYGRVLRECNIKEGEVLMDDINLTAYKRSFRFRTMDELKKKMAEEFAALDDAEFRDYSAWSGETEVIHTLNWVSVDKDGVCSVSNESEEKFKRGDINLYEHDLYFNITQLSAS